MMWTYLVRCRDGSLYAGWTTDLEKRLAAHNAGRGAKYTRGRRPVALVWAEAHESKNAAMAREAHIKRMTKRQKEALILQNQPHFEALAKTAAFNDTL